MQFSANSHSLFLSRMSQLTEDVLRDAYWGAKIQRLFEIVGSFDAGIVQDLKIDNPENQRLQRFVRFCLPLFELRKEATAQDFNPSLLAAMYLCQEVWPPLD